MPIFDVTGSQGQGSTTGRGQGSCNQSGRTSGFPNGRCQGLGKGSGRGNGQGFGRGNGWYPPAYGPTYPMSPADELNMLKAEADYMKDSLDAINKRIVELEKKTSE